MNYSRPILAITGCALAIALAIVWYSKVGDRVYRIRYIVPDNFVGVFRIVESPEGIDPRVKDGVYEFVIPEDGTLVVVSMFPLDAWHKSEAQWSNGEMLPVRAPEGVSLHYLATDHLGHRYFVVGTAAEADELRRGRPSLWRKGDELERQKR